MLAREAAQREQPLLDPLELARVGVEVGGGTVDARPRPRRARRAPGRGRRAPGRARPRPSAPPPRAGAAPRAARPPRPPGPAPRRRGRRPRRPAPRRAAAAGGRRAPAPRPAAGRARRARPRRARASRGRARPPPAPRARRRARAPPRPARPRRRGPGRGRRAAKASSSARWPRASSSPRSSCWPCSSTSVSASARSVSAVTRRSLTQACRRPSAARRAAQDQLVRARQPGLGQQRRRRMAVGQHELRRHLALGGAGADLAAAAPAEHEAQAVEQDRLAGAGLAGQHVQPRPEAQLGGLDQHHVADRERLQHRSGPAAPQRHSPWTTWR